MATERVEFVITADVRDAERGIVDVTSSLDNMGDKAVASARKVARADRAVESLGKESGRSANNLESLKFAAQGAGGRIGEMAGRVEAAGRAVALLGGPGGIAIAAGAAVAGVGVAAVASAASMVKLTRAASEYIKEAEDLGMLDMFEPGDVARVEGAAAALSAAEFAAKGLAVQIASNLAPSTEFLAQGAVAASLALGDYFETWAQGESIARSAIDGIGMALRPLVDAQAGYLKLLLRIRELVEGDVDPLNPSVQRQQKLREQIASLDRLSFALGRAGESATAIVRTGLADYWDEAGSRVQSYTRALEDLDDVQKAQIEGAVDFVGLIDRANAIAAAAAADTLTAEDKINAAYEERIRLLDQIEARLGEGPLAVEEQIAAVAALDEAAAQAAARREREIAALAESAPGGDAGLAETQERYNQSLAGSVDLASTLFGILADGQRRQGEDSKAAARRAILLDGASAVVKSIATLGPPIPPNIAGISGLASVAAITASQLAQVNQSFDRGGVVQGSRYPNGTPGQVVVQAEAGEAIFSQQQLDMLGNMGGGGTTVVELRVGNRTTESIMVDNRRAGGSFSRVRTPRATSQRRYTR